MIEMGRRPQASPGGRTYAFHGSISILIGIGAATPPSAYELLEAGRQAESPDGHGEQGCVADAMRRPH